MQPSQSQHPNVLDSLPAGITNQHTSSKGPTQARRFSCTKCRFTTKDSESFERHWAQHAGVTYTCLVCGHISYTKVESQRHNVQHSGKFPFRCEFCSYGAVRRDYVAKHVQRVHSKLLLNSVAQHSQGTSQNVLIMGAQPVSIASVAEVGLPTLISATEQTTKAPGQPLNTLNIVPNLIPLSLNQPQGSNPTQVNYQFGGDLSKSVSIMPNTFLNPQGQSISVAGNRDSLSTNLNPTGPSQLISITPVRIPNTANQQNNVPVTNSSFATVNQPKFSGRKVLAGVNQSTSIASGMMSIGPKQSAHTTTANMSNHQERRAPPIILRKTQQRPSVPNGGFVPNVVTNGFPLGSHPASTNNDVLARFNQPASVASNTFSVAPSQARSVSTAASADSLNRSSFQTHPNVSLNTQLSSVRMAPKPLVAYNEPPSVTLSRVPSTHGQAFLSNGLVSVNNPFRPTLGAVPNQPEKRVSLASGLGSNVANRFGNTLDTQSRGMKIQMGSTPVSSSPQISGLLGPSLDTQSRVMKSQMGRTPASTSPQISSLLGQASGNRLINKTSGQGMCAPVQVELLEPLQQPIYEQTLTVSYPEKVNIPPGSLVELVNVNMVNGAQELQFRVLPGQSLGSSVKNGPQPTTAPVVGTASKGGMLTAGQALSRDKGHTNPVQACPVTKSSQAFPVSNAKIPQKSCAPIKINAHSDVSYTVKEEQHEQVLSRPQELNKAPSSVVPVSQAACLPTVGITIRRTENTYSSTSFATSRPQDRITAATSNPQNPPSSVSMNNCRASATLPVTNGTCNIQMDRGVLPVISSVYSLGDKTARKGPQVERRLLNDSCAKSHGPGTRVEARINTQFVPCSSSEEIRRLLLTKANCVEPAAQNGPVHLPGGKVNKLLQPSALQPLAAGKYTCQAKTVTSVNNRLNTVHPESSDALSIPTSVPTVHRPIEEHPPPQWPQRCIPSPDLDTQERTICGVRIIGFTPQSYKQLFTMVPKVCLAKISEQNTSNHSHNILKLRLKRKKCQTDDDSADIFEALALPLTDASMEEPFDVSQSRQRKERFSGKCRKLSGSVDSCRLNLTSVKEDQPVKWPSPNQPVVVLNHPHPRVLRCGGERSPQSPGDGKGVAPLRIVLFRDTHKVVTELVKSPSLKMTFKKVHGEQYQVTELLAEGISSSLGD